ncbi:hypothetical protein ABN763_05610 [Spongiivirga sp. MCCC 1A20706]|uniref:hypothetical protein n=1 Tax=Spongiivirga sp. MCCC 1A20706 TaxID=3160963 RepID=UPI003977317C
MKYFTGFLTTLFLLLFVETSAQKALKIGDYYPISDGNTWRYTAPEGWKDVDYISSIKKEENQLVVIYKKYGLDVPAVLKSNSNNDFYKHFDATKTAKLLVVNAKGVWYFGELFSNNGGTVLFEQPILWFSSKFEVGDSVDEERNFNRYYEDGTVLQGTFHITQKIEAKATVVVPAGTFKDCLRIAFDTHWDFGKGSEAKSINVYHYSKQTGVVKASARFIILKNKKELINRLVEPDLKSYGLN